MNIPIIIAGVPRVLATTEVLDELSYMSYKHQREQSPHTSPDSWRIFYGDNVDKLEARYQRERAEAK